ncbi:MAG: phosphoribosylaminoimidazole-succinocarboxamide synthase [Thermodesulfobacteriota bacterium]|nr:phosphoribosylaminoimidazole-succinocarboxamide synthase [Thermodesulfobacteriota bacterium]
MTTQAPLMETNIPSAKLIGRGKVRDIYDVGENLLIISTDRISAFDVIMPNPIPVKGIVLNNLSIFWMKRTDHLVPNHFITSSPSEYPSILADHAHQVQGRSMLVKKAKVFPVECVARGYIIGSGWKDYQREGSICGIPLPAGLRLADKLPEPIFTPSTKAVLGDHDENISFGQAKDLVGEATANWLRDTTLQLYLFGSKWAEERGIIIADTKFEFGLIDDVPSLVDEILTPDSSRFWPVDRYQPGISPPSLDKQFLRDYLETLEWNKTAPGPALPEEIIHKTSEKYRSLYQILTGETL